LQFCNLVLSGRSKLPGYPIAELQNQLCCWYNCRLGVVVTAHITGEKLPLTINLISLSINDLMPSPILPIWSRA
jgi:hypothetical protein